MIDIRSPQLDGAEISWFAPICNGDTDQLGFGLYFIRSFAQILGENGQIPILLSAWAAPLAAVLLGLGLLLRTEDG